MSKIWLITLHAAHWNQWKAGKLVICHDKLGNLRNIERFESWAFGHSQSAASAFAADFTAPLSLSPPSSVTKLSSHLSFLQPFVFCASGL